MEILYVTPQDELQIIDDLSKRLISAGYNASNCIIITVSTDYSSIVGQILRHNLTYNGEIAPGFGIDVPYPDQTWDDEFIRMMSISFTSNVENINGRTPILVEAGVIRGGNYTYVVDWMKNNLYLPNGVVTLAMYENAGSKFKSDFVGKYYDAIKQDLTFWWEKDNKHWI